MKRYLYKDIYKRLNDKQFIILTGPRQVGKTTLLKQMYDELSVQYNMTFYINLEEPGIYNLLNEHPENLFKYVSKPPDRVSDVSEKFYVFIDEIQYLKNPSNFLKYNYDFYADTLKLIVTGSSAFYIDTKFKDSLAGRKWLFQMYSLSFEEFLEFRGHENLLSELKRIRFNKELFSVHKRELFSLLDEYISYGGYPAVVLTKDIEEKKEILKELVHTYLKRDMMESGILSEDRMYKLLSLLAHNTGGLLNNNSLAKILDVSPHTVENYVTTLRKCFQIQTIKPYFTNIGKSLRKMPKFYFNDTGFRNLLLNDFRNISVRQDKGFLFENYAYIRFRDNFDTDRIYFWRTSDGNEIDFIIEDMFRQGNAFEIKFDGREFKKDKYRKFLKSFPDFNIDCVSYNGENNTYSGVNI